MALKSALVCLGLGCVGCLYPELDAEESAESLSGGASGAPTAGGVGSQSGLSGAVGAQPAGAGGQGGSGGDPIAGSAGVDAGQAGSAGAGGATVGGGGLGSGGAGSGPPCTAKQAFRAEALPVSTTWSGYSYSHQSQCVNAGPATFKFEYPFLTWEPTWPAVDTVRFLADQLDNQAETVSADSGACDSESACSMTVGGELWITAQMSWNGSGYKLQVTKTEGAGFRVPETPTYQTTCTNLPDQWNGALEQSTRTAVIAAFEALTLSCP